MSVLDEALIAYNGFSILHQAESIRFDVATTGSPHYNNHSPAVGGPFIDVPQQLGFNFKADPAGCLDTDPHSASEVTVLLQSWLFFWPLSGTSWHICQP